MREFAEIVEALKAGQEVRHAAWEPTSRGFIRGKQFVIQCGEGEPYPYDLSWWEIVSKKWSLLAA